METMVMESGLEKRRQIYIKNYKNDWTKYNEFAACVLNMIKKALKDRQIYIAYSSSRAKKVESLEKKCNKMQKNENGKLCYKYSDFRTEIMDLSGVRIVTYLLEDIEEVSKIIRDLFDVIEEHSGNKLDLLAADRIGYLSVHYIVKLKEDKIVTGEEQYQDLLCEIQVRTVLEDAWAQVFHDRQYKAITTPVPISNEIQRRTNLLSGNLELLDYQINELVKEYDKESQVDKKRKMQFILGCPIEGKILLKYLEIKINKRLIFYDYKTVEKLLNMFRIRSMRGLNAVFEDTHCDNTFDDYRGHLTGDKVIRLVLIIKYGQKYFERTDEKLFLSDESRTFLQNYIDVEKVFNYKKNKEAFSNGK